jgi:hypothetical protein
MSERFHSRRYLRRNEYSPFIHRKFENMQKVIQTINKGREDNNNYIAHIYIESFYFEICQKVKSHGSHVSLLLLVTIFSRKSRFTQLGGIRSYDKCNPTYNSSSNENQANILSRSHPNCTCL